MICDCFNLEKSTEPANVIEISNDIECTVEPVIIAEQPVVKKQGRKSKQRVLNDYFEVLESKANETKEKLNETIESADSRSSTVARSSRGRVIKPKTFDIEIFSKKSNRKSRNEATEAQSIVQPQKIKEDESKPELTFVKTPKKRGRETKTDSIFMDSDIIVNEIKHNKEPVESVNQSFVASTPISQPHSTWRKGTTKLHTTSADSIADNVTTITENRKMSSVECANIVTMQIIDAATADSSNVQDVTNHKVSNKVDSSKIIVENAEIPENHISPKRTRVPRKSIKNEPNVQSDTTEAHNEEQTVDQSIETDERQQIKIENTSKRRRCRSQNATVESPIEILNETFPLSIAANDLKKEATEEIFKTPILDTKKRRARISKNAPALETSMQAENVDQMESPTLLAQPELEIPQETNTLPSVQSTPTPSPTPKRRGRPRLTPLAVAEDPEPNQPKFTCGNCQQPIAESKWKAHEAVHVGVTWRVGIDEPIDVDDTATVSRLMVRYMKQKKIQYLKCEKCGEKKKSAVGYISHIEVCGLTPDEVKALKAECEFCKKLYRKVSLASHQQTFCPVRRLEVAQQLADAAVNAACESGTNEQNEEIVYSESGRPKRKIKKIRPTSKPVEDFIKVGLKITGGTFKNWTIQLRETHVIKCSNENCTFTTAEIKEMRSHYMQCRDSLLHCKLCSQTSRSRDEIVQHIESVHADELKIHVSDDDIDNPDDDDFKAGHHSSSSSDDDYADDEDRPHERGGRKHFKQAKRKRTIPLKRIVEDESPAYWEMLQSFYTRILNTRSGYYRKAFQWTKEFVEQNYDLDALSLKIYLRNSVEHVRLPQREVNKFLGLLESESIKFLCQKQTEYTLTKSDVSEENDNWSELKLFESVKSDHIKTQSAVLFCGGTIISADWIPFPKEYTGNQVLVICSRSKGTKPINVTNMNPAEKCKNLIQLWSISTTSESEIQQTEFMYGIAYDDGPICVLSFCPSDAYIAKKRLAIAALPDTNGNINIISLPDNVSKAKSNVPPVVKLKPEIRLQLGLKANEVAAQTVTQMVWSRVKGHKVLCAGFNTGLVAIWNFDHMNSTYLCQKNASDGIPVLLPQYTFMGASSYITQLDLHADNDGSMRWLLVGALDRKMRLYDLYDPQLIPFTSQIFKSRIISGAWPLHWPIYLTIIDAVLTRMNGGLHIKPILYTNNQPRSTNHFNDCEPSNLAFSDWLNTALFGNDVGDLFMINFQQLLLHDRFDESSELKVLSTTDVFIEPSQCNDSESNNGIRILFNDFDDTVYAPKMKTRIQPVEQHPHARITRVAVNPNESHHKLYAIGYELGFCRIHFFP